MPGQLTKHLMRLKLKANYLMQLSLSNSKLVTMVIFNYVTY
jgi:hypothetical protein